MAYLSSDFLGKDLYQNIQSKEQESIKQKNDLDHIIQSLRKENEELRKEIEVKDQTINAMSVEFNPMKKNLLLKIGLLCERLKITSENDYQAWIEEVEVSRIRAKFNESTILTLETTLKEYKEKILDLETQLRCFGVDLKDGKSVPINLNHYLEEIYKISESLTEKLAQSQNTIKNLELCLNGNNEYSNQINNSAPRTQRKYKTYNLQDTVYRLQNTLEEISDKIDTYETHEGIKQDLIKKLKTEGLQEIESNSIQNLDKALKLSNFLALGKVQNKALNDELNQITSKKFNVEKEKLSTLKIKKILNETKSLSNIHQKLIVLIDRDRESYELQDLIHQAENLIEYSDKTLSQLLNSYPRFIHKKKTLDKNKENLRLSCRRSSEGLENYFKGLLSFLSDQENLKQEILAADKQFFDSKDNFIKSFIEKFEKEEPVLRSLCELAKLPFSLPKINNSISVPELLELDTSHIDIYKKCLQQIPNIDSVYSFIKALSTQVFELIKFLDKLGKLLVPGDKSFGAVLEKLDLIIKDTEDILRGGNISESGLNECFGHINETLMILIRSFVELSFQIPEAVPSLEDLQSLNELMQDSNYTITVLSRAFDKVDKYKEIVGTENIPSLEIDIDRDFSLRWKWMNAYINRVSEVGKHLEKVKRTIIEDDFDIKNKLKPEDFFGKTRIEEEKIIQLIQSGISNLADTSSKVLRKMDKKARITPLSQHKETILNLQSISQAVEDLINAENEKLKALEEHPQEIVENEEIKNIEEYPEEIEFDKNTKSGIPSGKKSKSLRHQTKGTPDESRNLDSKGNEILQELDSLKAKSEVLEEESKRLNGTINFYKQNFKSIGKNLEKLFKKSKVVGDNLDRASPDEYLQNERNIIEDQLQQAIDALEKTEDPSQGNIDDILDLVNRYEELNQTQASQLSSLSDPRPPKTSKNIQKTEGKKLRSGKLGIKPSSTSSPEIELSKQDILNWLKLINFEPQDSSYIDYEETTKYVIKTISNYLILIKENEIEREKILYSQIKALHALVPLEQAHELKALEQIFEDSKVLENDSFASVISKSRAKNQIQNDLLRIRQELGYKENIEEIKDELEELLYQSTRLSFNTVKLIFSSGDLLESFKEKLVKVSLSKDPKSIIIEAGNSIRNLIEMENYKQKLLGSYDLSKWLYEFLEKHQMLSIQKSDIIEKLWELLIQLIGTDSSKNFLKFLRLSLPGATSDVISDNIVILTQTQSLIEDYIAKNQKQIKEFIGKQQEVFSYIENIEEELDDIIRKNLKELYGEDQAIQKQLNIIKEDFEEISQKLWETIENKLSHLSQDLNLFSKLEKIKEKTLQNYQKAARKLENDLNISKNEFQTLKSSSEIEKSLILEKLKLSENTLKETKSSLDIISKEKSNKEIEISQLNNSLNTLEQEISDLKDRINNQEDEISDLKKTIQTSRSNLTQKKNEIIQLQDRLSQYESSLPVKSIDDQAVADLESKIRELELQVNLKNKELEEKDDDYLTIKRDKKFIESDFLRSNELLKSYKEELGNLKGKIIGVEALSRDVVEKNKLGVDRNDQEIQLIIQQLKSKQAECDQLQKQLEPSSNYRVLLSETRLELDSLKKEKEDLEIYIKSLTSKISLLDKENQSLKYDNRDMYKFKDEWVDTKATCEVLEKKLAAFDRLTDKDEGNCKEVIENLTKDLKESAENIYALKDKIEAFESEVEALKESVTKVRKRNTCFKIFATNRIKCYYRLNTWQQVAEKPLPAEREDPNLIELYTKYVQAKINLSIIPETSDYILHILQKSLNNSLVKLQYKKYSRKVQPLPKLSLFKLFDEFLVEKSKFDSKMTEKLESYESVPHHFFYRLRDIYGNRKLTNSALSEFVIGLYSLYQEGNPFATLICKLLQYLDPTPITNLEAPIIIEAYALLSDKWKNSVYYHENNDTAGIFDFNECLDVLRNVLEEDPEAYKQVLDHLQLSINEDKSSILIVLHEIFTQKLTQAPPKLSENQKITEWIPIRIIQDVENAHGLNFYTNLPSQTFLEECKNIKITGTDLLNFLLEGLIKLKSVHISKLLIYFKDKPFISAAEFSGILKTLKPEIDDQTIDKLAFFAISQSEDKPEVSLLALYNSLYKNKFPGYSIQGSHPIKKTLFEESKSIESPIVVEKSDEEIQSIKTRIKKKKVKKVA